MTVPSQLSLLSARPTFSLHTSPPASLNPLMAGTVTVAPLPLWIVFLLRLVCPLSPVYTPDEVYKLLISVKVKTASGPDGISSYMLRNTARAISPTLTELFNVSLSSGTVPSEWKLSNITPVFKGKGDPRCVMNYRPISLLPRDWPVVWPSKIGHQRFLNGLYTTTS